jgi:hypothetical protein
MKAYVGVDTYIKIFLSPVLVGELLPSGLGRSTPGERLPYA